MLEGAKPFQKGVSGNAAGRPKGSLSLSTRARALLEGGESLPPAIATTIRKVVVADKSALDATIIAGLLHALQGDDKWAKLLWEYAEFDLDFQKDAVAAIEGFWRAIYLSEPVPSQ